MEMRLNNYGKLLKLQTVNYNGIPFLLEYLETWAVKLFFGSSWYEVWNFGLLDIFQHNSATQLMKNSEKTLWEQCGECFYFYFVRPKNVRMLNYYVISRRASSLNHEKSREVTREQHAKGDASAIGAERFPRSSQLCRSLARSFAACSCYPVSSGGRALRELWTQTVVKQPTRSTFLESLDIFSDTNTNI